jgi:sigma-B regulation protein RsbU (phosphoserine phosphatase)
VNAVVQAVVDSALGATAASAGWVLSLQGDHLTVVAAVGGSGQLVGRQVPAGAGTAGFVVSTGQPMAMAAREGDARLSEGVLALLPERPSSVLCVPCASGDNVVGVLELVDKAGGGTFSFDDVEVATLLAGIAAAALETDGNEVGVRSPDELGAELRALAASDPTAYARVATLVDAILARG